MYFRRNPFVGLWLNFSVLLYSIRSVFQSQSTKKLFDIIEINETENFTVYYTYNIYIYCILHYAGRLYPSVKLRRMLLLPIYVMIIYIIIIFIYVDKIGGIYSIGCEICLYECCRSLNNFFFYQYAASHLFFCLVFILLLTRSDQAFKPFK